MSQFLRYIVRADALADPAAVTGHFSFCIKSVKRSGEDAQVKRRHIVSQQLAVNGSVRFPCTVDVGQIEEGRVHLRRAIAPDFSCPGGCP